MGDRTAQHAGFSVSGVGLAALADFDSHTENKTDNAAPIVYPIEIRGGVSLGTEAVAAQKITDRPQLRRVNAFRIVYRQEKGSVAAFGKESSVCGKSKRILGQNVRVGAQAEADRHAFGQRITDEIFSGNAENLNEQIYVLYPDGMGRVGIVAEIAVVFGRTRLHQAYTLKRGRIFLQVFQMKMQQPLLFLQPFDLLLQTCDCGAVALQQTVTAAIQVGGGDGIQGEVRPAQLPDVEKV